MEENPYHLLHAELNSDSIKMVVRHNLPQLKGCYERAVKDRGTVSGTVEIEFVISALGTVQKADVHRNSTGHEGLGLCIAAILKRWRFPKPIGGEAEFIFPFQFSSGD